MDPGIGAFPVGSRSARIAYSATCRADIGPPGLPQRREAKPHLFALPKEQPALDRPDGGDQLAVGCRRE
jgi:hypothetical protein